MQALSLLHRWIGGIVGLVLALIGLSGAALMWEEAWIGVPGAEDPYRSSTTDLAQVTQAAFESGQSLSRITYASADFGLHLATYADGSGAYFDQSARLVDRWSSMWGRPELWLFDLHHYLFLGHSGEYVAGVLGILLIVFTISGAILWWRTRKTFAFRLWPRRMSRSAIVRQHRDLGVVASPLLLVSALTGSLMLFQPVSDVLLAPWTVDPVAQPTREYSASVAEHPEFSRIMSAAQAPFPQAQPRRLMMPKAPGEPVVMRLKQDFEWTPNGRSYAYLDPASGSLLGTDDPALASTQQAIEEKYYPVHAGKVGGFLWKLALTFGGLSLALLGTLASWSFWFRRNDGKAKPVRRVGEHAPVPAE